MARTKTFGPSPRKIAAEIVAAAIREFGLNKVYGGEVGMEPWGRGKRYAVGFSVPRLLDGAAYINAPDEIELTGQGRLALNATVDSAERAVAVLWVALQQYDGPRADELVAGAPLWRVVPLSALVGVSVRLAEAGIPMPAAWREELTQGLARRHIYTETISGSREDLARYLSGKPLDGAALRRISSDELRQFEFQYHPAYGLQDCAAPVVRVSE